MKQKMTYFAPETESMEVRMEQNILLSGNAVMGSLGNSSTEDATDYDGGSAISW